MAFKSALDAETSSTVPVHWLMFDSDDPESSRLMLNAVNIYFIRDLADNLLDLTEVSIDIIHTKERTAMQWQTIVYDKLLRKGGIIKKQDYDTNPSSPTDLYGSVFWDIRDIIWEKIPNDNYCHYNATIVLHHHTQPSS